MWNTLQHMPRGQRHGNLPRTCGCRVPSTRHQLWARACCPHFV